jgi:hypothetical protein
MGEGVGLIKVSPKYPQKLQIHRRFMADDSQSKKEHIKRCYSPYRVISNKILFTFGRALSGHSPSGRFSLCHVVQKLNCYVFVDDVV